MKDDTISRQAAIDALDKRFGNVPMEQTAEILKLRKDLRKLPSAQPTVNTARHGHWIFRPFPDDWIGSLYICSECKDFCDSRYRFCPSCGAKMDEF